MTESKPVLQVIIASIREGRIGKPIGEWVAAQAREHGAFDVEVVDLKDVALPPMTEPNHPRMQKYTQQSTKDWSATVSRADAFVFVMPEYNFGYTSTLKNALDTVFVEWSNKVVGLVSYGGVSGGLRATTALRTVLAAFPLHSPSQGVVIPMAMGMIEDGTFTPSKEVAESLAPMLDAVHSLQAATSGLRG